MAPSPLTPITARSIRYVLVRRKGKPQTVPEILAALKQDHGMGDPQAAVIWHLCRMVESGEVQHSYIGDAPGRWDAWMIPKTKEELLAEAAASDTVHAPEA